MGLIVFFYESNISDPRCYLFIIKKSLFLESPTNDSKEFKENSKNYKCIFTYKFNSFECFKIMRCFCIFLVELFVRFFGRGIDIFFSICHLGSAMLFLERKNRPPLSHPWPCMKSLIVGFIISV